MNKTPIPHSPAHAEALEAYRSAQAQLDRHISDERVFNGRSDETLANQPEFQALVASRDVAREFVGHVDPKVTPPKKRKGES